MKLSAILGPLLDAQADHELIRSMILAHEAAQADALEKRRESDRVRQAAKAERDRASRDSRERYDGVSSHAGVTRVEDNLQTKNLDGKTEKKEVAPSSRGTRLPDDWQPDFDFARSVGLSDSQAQTEATKFREWWPAQSGQKAVKSDWGLTWKTWCRKAAEGRRSTAPPGQPPRNVGEQARADLRQLGILPNAADPSTRRLETRDRDGHVGGTGFARRIASA